MSKDNQAAFEKTVASLSSAMRTTILNTAVKLTGQTAKGSSFTGSRVMVYSVDGVTTLVSAKHNLYVFADEKDPPARSDTLATDFESDVNGLGGYGPA